MQDKQTLIDQTNPNDQDEFYIKNMANKNFN